jgi:anion-transporting  ArsA/GET3 family ATPase
MAVERRPAMPPFPASLLREKKVIVCCGAGGVGKTTTAAALGLAAAGTGRRVLVLTIDPARRLAEAMGIPASGPTPARVPEAKLREGNISGTLDAWMLDPKVVFEQMVRRLAESPEKAESILKNRIYRALSELVAGMQEYTAAEALYTFVESGKYDVVVLDTPPSRNALEFLEAPRKLSLFLDEKIIGVFLPHGGSGGGLFWRNARQLASSVLGRVFGEGFFEEIQGFLGAFSGMFTAMRAHSEAVRKLLLSDESSFVVITSPDRSAMAESRFLDAKLKEMQLPFAGYVLNRSWAYTRGLKHPRDAEIPAPPGSIEHAVVEKLARLADEELRLAARDRELLAELRERAGAAVATPQLDAAIEDFAGLLYLAESLASPSPAEDPSKT